jgi:hypothetical protein
MTFWQAYRQATIWSLQGLGAALLLGIPLTAAWYFVWKGWYVAAVAVVIVALSGALALQARSIQRRQS